ncbi:MAG: twin-arginine translocation signal domain-containing protein, partial [Longimicrobiales bacterium]
MSTNRRDFLKLSAAAGGAVGLGLPAELLGATDRPTGSEAVHAGAPPRRALRILILGGTGFIGPHMVRYALDRGHEVTL